MVLLPGSEGYIRPGQQRHATVRHLSFVRRLVGRHAQRTRAIGHVHAVPDRRVLVHFVRGQHRRSAAVDHSGDQELRRLDRQTDHVQRAGHQTRLHIPKRNAYYPRSIVARGRNRDTTSVVVRIISPSAGAFLFYFFSSVTQGDLSISETPGTLSIWIGFSKVTPHLLIVCHSGVSIETSLKRKTSSLISFEFIYLNVQR